jgi:hypothetical protein
LLQLGLDICACASAFYLHVQGREFQELFPLSPLFLDRSLSAVC